MNELQAHIEAKNAKTLEWVNEDPANRWAAVPVSDPEHWAEYGIYTVEQYEHHMAAMSLYDYYKDVHGIRPRWMNFDEMSIEDIEAEFRALDREAEAQAEVEEYWDMIDAEAEKVEELFADPVPTKYELLAEQAGY